MNVIIVGCGRVGAELAASAAEQGHDVVVIDRNPDAFQRLEHEFRGRTLQGDVRDKSVLARADIEHADGFAAVTSNDEINLVAAHTARELYNVPNVVARVYDPTHTPAFKRAGLQTVISSSWSAHRIEQLLTHPGITELAIVGNGEALLIEVQVPIQMVGKPISFFAQESTCQPAALIRAGHASLPQPDTILQDGDLIVAAVLSSNISLLETIKRNKGKLECS
jgi:trk system potassium uptake protein TrkA